MFGRRKHRAQPATPVIETVVPALNRTQIEQAVRAVINEQIGVNGRWVLQRRDDTVDVSDTIFQTISCASLSREILDAVFGENSAQPDAHDTTAQHGSPQSERRDAREQRDYIERELTSIAAWADPVRHDPSVIPERLVAPISSDSQATRSSAS